MVFLILEALSGWMLFSFNAYQGSVWFTQANAVAGYVLEQEAKVLQYVHMTDRNFQLTQEITKLQQENELLRTRLAELTRDSSYTEKVQVEVLKDQTLIPARVITNSVKQKDNYITLDCGRSHGVRPEMGVVSGTGIVGITYLVSEHYSVVLPVLNSHSSVSCRLRGTNYFGTLKWDGGSPLLAYMDDIPRHAVAGLAMWWRPAASAGCSPPASLWGKSYKSATPRTAFPIGLRCRWVPTWPK